MPKHPRQSENYEQPTIDEQQRRSSLVTGFLEQLALPSLFNRDLTEADYELWQKLLAPYPIKAIEYAFQNWGRNGKQFPKPSNILELIAAWSLSSGDRFRCCDKCESGWIRVFEGLTDGGRTVDPKVGAAVRCQCLKSWIKQRRAQAA